MGRAGHIIRLGKDSLCWVHGCAILLGGVDVIDHADDEELVTVVVPARNEAAAIEACLRSVLEQTWRSMEVLVVDGDSTDGTPDVVARMSEEDERIRLIKNPDRIIPVALNLALAEARGRWLVRVDAHATIPPDYVSRAVVLLRTGLFGGVGGRKIGIGRTAAGRAISVAMASRFGVGGSAYHHANAAQDAEHVPFGCYPVDVLRSIGGWNEQLRVNQDFELDYRLRQAGYRIRLDPDLYINWECRQSIGDLAQQYRRYGRGKLRVAALHPASLRVRHGAAPALVVWLGIAAVTAPRRPRVAVAMVAPYVAGVTVATYSAGRDLDADARRYLPAAFVAMHVAWGVGFWEGVVQLAAEQLRSRRGRV
jgi:succinoglycan biosynthesis protein ExoA